MNHEYLDEGLLFPDGQKTWTAEKVLKAQHAVGVSVIEVEQRDGAWRVIMPSRHARRITARTPCRLSGPAAGHALVRTAADPAGRLVLGTYNGCAHGWTPWGTYLTCEENWHFHFVNRGTISADQRRYRITAAGRRYRWEEFDERFDAGAHPNEPNRFGWVVEIDPRDPQAAPIKRTALGRMAHEGAACSVGPDGRLAFYMADDWEFEYVYKFVTARAWDPARREANRDLLDEGVLYAARFNPDGSGDWLPLVHGQGPLTAANGFADQGAVLVRTRQAADALGATRMDRPEWIVPHPVTREVYCACTGNTARGRDGNEGPNPANPRAPNPFGHLLRWRDDGGDPAATRFRWDVFVQAGPSGQGHHQGRRVRLPGRALDRLPRHALGADGRVAHQPRQGRLRAARQQSDAGRRPGGGRVQALPHRAPGMRDHRLSHDARQPHGVREHPAPRRGGGRPLESRRAAGPVELARLPARRPARAPPPSSSAAATAASSGREERASRRHRSCRRPDTH